jgi:hypothetical protein
MYPWIRRRRLIRRRQHEENARSSELRVRYLKSGKQHRGLVGPRGYREFLLVKKPPPECLCPKCKNVAMDPVIFSPCGHMLCRRCDMVEFCPQCSEMRQGASAKAIRIRGTIQSLKVFCRIEECKAIFPLEQAAQHEKRCEYMWEECIYCQSRFKRSEWEVPSSHKRSCDLRAILKKDRINQQTARMVEESNRELEKQVKRLEEENKRWRWRCDVSNQLLSENRLKRFGIDDREG